MGGRHLDVEHEASFARAFVETGINLVLGSGFSAHAYSDDGNPLPTGSSLAQELIDNFELTIPASLGLDRICTIIKKDHGARLNAFLKRRLTVDTFDDRYLCLDALQVKTILTTNVDDLILRVFAESSRHYLNDLDVEGPAFRDRRAVDYAALHGSVRSDKPMRFTSLELSTAWRNDPDMWHFLVSCLRSRPTLFWGHSLGDAALLEALHPSTRGERTTHRIWATVHPDSPAGTEEYFVSLGFEVVRADTSSMLDYMCGLSTGPTAPALQITGPTADRFPDDAIPGTEGLLVRPIEDFFRGAAPTWTDVASGKIPRTSQFAELTDRLDAGINPLAIGLPGCGKTTLLMQLARNYDFAGHKLFCDNVSPDKAALIIQGLQGEPALVFIDNFTDSVQAVSRLLGEKNIRVIGADRDYNYDIVKHLIPAGACRVVDVTELSAADLQSVFDAIPSSLRLQRFVKPRVEPPFVPSIFEVAQANLAGPTLQRRFGEVIKQLLAADDGDLLVDLLVVTCYVQSCRTPVSMDMLLAFLRGRIADYEDVYSLVETMGTMLSDQPGFQPDDLQDYFSPRSPALSEAILEVVPPEVLRRVLIEFWNEVSPYRIHRYRTFVRHAFDWRLIYKAFPDPEEGKAFFTNVFAIEDSPYVKQHGALYLAHKKRYAEAFAWIDEALEAPPWARHTGSWTIKNSHAIILFRANIDVEETPEGDVRATLDRSMSILSECYAKDRRKTYHAVTYGDHALKYANRFHDEAAREYLATARTWLAEERRSSPWHRRVQQLLGLVTQALREWG